MNLTDSIAFASRKIAQTRLHKLSEALRRFYPMKNGLTTIHNFDGDLRINIDRGSFMSSAIYWRGHYSDNIVRFLKGYLRPNMSFVDVGANLGELTLFAAKRLSGGRVLAFEPSPPMFSELSKNVLANVLTNVYIFNIGLFDKTDSLPIYRMRDFKFGTVNEGVPSLFSTGSELQEAVVPLRRFDDVASEVGVDRVDVIKIDVEGAEMMVLRGAEASIRRFRPIIIVEMSDANFQKAGYTSTDLIDYLNYLEYNIRLLDGEDGRVPLQCNMICHPR